LGYGGWCPPLPMSVKSPQSQEPLARSSWMTLRRAIG
jgi:hypothetical protein